MKQISLKVNDAKFEVFLDFLKTLDYIEIKEPKWKKELKKKVDFPEKLDTGCATDFEEASIKNAERLKKSIQQLKDGNVIEVKELLE